MRYLSGKNKLTVFSIDSFEGLITAVDEVNLESNYSLLPIEKLNFQEITPIWDLMTMNVSSKDDYKLAELENNLVLHRSLLHECYGEIWFSEDLITFGLKNLKFRCSFSKKNIISLTPTFMTQLQVTYHLYISYNSSS